MTYKKYTYHEDSICKEFVIKLNLLIKNDSKLKGLIYYHIPNGGWRTKKTGELLKSLGVMAGVSDYFIMRAAGKFHGLYIEFKYKNNKPTEKQQEFLRVAEKEGYKTCVVNSADEAIKTIYEYLK